MNTKGFTLVELIIVVAILGILAMIAIPAYLGMQKRAARAEAYSNLQTLRLLEEQYYADNGCYYMSGGICANGSITNAAIQNFLPKFRPCDMSDADCIKSLSFDYSLSVYNNPDSGDTSGAFTATATGKSGSRVSGESFYIEHDNDKNF